jgi:hypothetical protein
MLLARVTSILSFCSFGNSAFYDAFGINLRNSNIIIAASSTGCNYIAVLFFWEQIHSVPLSAYI